MPHTPSTAKTPHQIPARSTDAAAKEEKDIWSLMSSLQAAPKLVSEDPAARLAMWNLVRAGVSDEYLLQALRAISDIAVNKRGGQVRDWALPPGLSRRQLKALPKRIENLAGQIERVNRHKLLAPDAWHKIYLTRGLRRVAQQLFREPRISPPYESAISMNSLPNAMKAYAARLQEQVERVSDLRKGPAKGTEIDFEVKRKVLELVTRVNDVLGKYRWRDLVDLLRPIVPNEPAWVNDADALRRFYRQNKHLLVL
jgi:hypothetical protein